MEGIKIKGVMKTSLIDYPGNIVSTIFLSRCNFRCGFCHNPELVNDEVSDDVPVKEFMDFLKKKKKWLDGICITGGEPTLHSGLKDFIKTVKELDMKVRLDTNGTNPGILKELIAEGLVDQIAMDIKSSLERYDEVTGVKVDKDAIKESIGILLEGKVDYMFRTTVMPRHYDADEAVAIGKLINGAKKYVLQRFRNTDKTLDHAYQHESSYLGDELDEFKKIMLKYVDSVDIKGVA